MKALPFFPNYTTFCLVSPDSNPRTIIEWNMLAEQRGLSSSSSDGKANGAKQLIVLAEANDKIPPKPKKKVVWRF